MNFRIADRVSADMIRSLCSETQRSGPEPVMHLLGLLKTLDWLIGTAPDEQPPSFRKLKVAVRECIEDIQREDVSRN